MEVRVVALWYYLLPPGLRSRQINDGFVGFRCMVYPCPNMSVVSHLGPLPMLLYIHDLTKISLWLSFAASKLDLHVGSDNRGRSGAEENRYAEG